MQLKYRAGEVDRQDGPDSCIVRNMFKKETDIAIFIGKQVVTAAGHEGTLEAKFGTAGKARVRFAYAVQLQPGTAITMVQRKYTKP